MRVYVTGASGFVGTRLKPALEAAGHVVIGADREVDVTDRRAVARALTTARPDALVHLAAQSSVADSLRAPDVAWRINYLGTRAVLQAVADEAPRARLLVIGSADQYAPTEPGGAPLSETTPLRPRSPYARSKAAAEQLARLAARDGLDVVCVRAFNHTGPGQTPRFVVPDFAQQIARIAAGLAEPVMRVGNLDSVRDFLDVRDVIAAYLRLLDPYVPADVYNVASGQGRSIAWILDRLCEKAGVSPRIERDPARHRPTDWLVGDPARLEAATGWRPQHDFDETLSQVLDAFRDGAAAERPAQPRTSR
jgi:GDP-4-dehydro-6-deoxy-D-mannose reductase